MKYRSLLLSLVICLGGAVRADIVLPAPADDCVLWAADNVREALKSKGISAETTDVKVTITPQRRRGEQSFKLIRSGQSIEIQAGGSLGTMYGLQELTEQIRNAHVDKDWKRISAEIETTEQTPFVEFRADNAFIHVYPLDLNDLEQWRAYIDMLARNRFNVLDLHGSYDLQSTSFPNLYPMLIHVPEYPTIGNEQEQARNLASFKALISYAKSRGIKVAFMNYSANDGRGGAEKNAPSVTGVPPEKLADYTAKAVTRLIQALPELAMLGFRVGESGQDAAFYKNAYIKGVVDAHRPDLRLYTRSWQTTKEQLLPLAEVAQAGFDIEVKFNGEHLGLPYHALQTSFGTYSYEGYLDVPANYQIIWQVRANGTHRFWSWENTSFIRRTINTFTLGNARGFTLEPPTAYFSTDPAAHYRSAEDRSVYRYMWQKQWAWYFAWGRLGFNPALSEKTLIQAYEQHFGGAGKTIYAAMQQASVVVPLVYAYRFPGPDHRDFSPETETGNLSAKRKNKISFLLQFIDNHPEDERSFAGIGSFVDAKLASQPDGRVSPLAVSMHLSDAAKATQELINTVPPLKGQAANEWRLMKTDLLSASWLGEYHARRITAMVYLGYALKTGREHDYSTAVQGLATSREAWKKLSETADAVYRPLSNPLRKQLDFQWGAQLESIEKLDATASELWAQHASQDDARPLVVTAADRGWDAGVRVEKLDHELTADKNHVTIRCHASTRTGVAKVVLWYKALPSQLAWQSVDMDALPDGSFAAKPDLTPEGLMYLVEVQSEDRQAENFPSVFKETPYRIIPAFAAKP